MSIRSNGVLLDTNSLIYSLKNRVDIQLILNFKFNIFRIAVPECVIRELENLSTSVPYAKGALLLSKRFEIIPARGHGDNCLIDTALDVGYSVLTNDRKLIERLREKGVSCLTIKGKNDITSV